jgi:hypothetical protein
MSNQGWGRLARRRSPGEKVFDAVTWPFRKVGVGLLMLLLLAFRKR